MIIHKKVQFHPPLHPKARCHLGIFVLERARRATSRRKLLALDVGAGRARKTVDDVGAHGVDHDRRKDEPRAARRGGGVVSLERKV